MLLGQDNEWAVAERRYFSAESMKRLLTPLAPASDHELLMAMRRNGGDVGAVRNASARFAGGGGRVCAFTAASASTLSVATNSLRVRVNVHHLTGHYRGKSA